MKVVKMPLSALKVPERNVRLHTDTQLKEFQRSVEMFGQIRPIVADETGTILAGNGLYETLKRMGRDSADVLRVSGLSENEKKKLMLADNKVYTLGVDDMSTLDAFLAELKGDLDIPGFDEELLQSMVAEASAITEQMADYGLLDNADVEGLEAAARRKETYMSAGIPQAEEKPPATPSAEESAPAPDGQPEPESKEPDAGEPVRRSIVCPHCGGTLWL